VIAEAFFVICQDAAKRLLAAVRRELTLAMVEIESRSPVIWLHGVSLTNKSSFRRWAMSAGPLILSSSEQRASVKAINAADQCDKAVRSQRHGSLLADLSPPEAH